MKTAQRALLLVGSPKGSRSTSESLGTYLLHRLREHGLETEQARILPAARSGERGDALLAAMDGADLLALAFPLYVDSLPAGVIRAMELFAQRREASAFARGQRLLAIANCGFPEARHNEVALGICRCFANKCGLEWAGGLALGGGAAIDGRPLGKAGGMVRHVKRSLNLAAEALAAGRPVPQEAVELMAKPMMPTWLYTFAGNYGWRRQARQHGVRGRLMDRPHA